MNKMNKMKGTDSFSEIQDQRKGYEREFAGYKPKFEGIAQGQYPNTVGNIILCILVFFPGYIVIGGVFALCIWLCTWHPNFYTHLCFWLLMGYISFLLIVVYWGSFGRLKVEREVLAKRRKEQLEEAAKKKKDREEAERLIDEYNKRL